MTVPAQPARSSRSRKNRRWWVGLAIVLLAGLLLAAPTLVSNRWFYQPFIDRFAKDKLELSIDSVHVRWFSPIVFEGIRISEKQDSDRKSPLLKIASIKSESSLLGFLLNGRAWGRLEVNEPVLDIALLEDGTNLEKVVKAIEEAKGKQVAKQVTRPAVDFDIAVRRLSVQIEPQGDGQAIQVIPPMDADISYRALDSEPTVIVHPCRVLDHVALTPELIRLGLGHAIPLLAKSAWFDGSVSLSTQEIRVVLQRPQQATGEAVLTLHQVRSGPSEPLIVGALDALARLRNKEPLHEIVFVDGSDVQVKVGNERVFHSGLEGGLPRLDPRLQVSTEGYVGIMDKSLDLNLEIPVPIEQVARRDTVKQLGVPRVALPIGGTLDEPEVKWNVMRGESAALLALISSRLQTEAPLTSTVVDALSGITEGQADQTIEAAVDFVKQFRQRRAQSQSERESAENENPGEVEETRRPLRDAFRRAIRGK